MSEFNFNLKEEINIILTRGDFLTKLRLNDSYLIDAYKYGPIIFESGCSESKIMTDTKTTKEYYDLVKMIYFAVKPLYEMHLKQEDLSKTIKKCSDMDFSKFITKIIYYTSCVKAIETYVSNVEADKALMENVFYAISGFLPEYYEYEQNKATTSYDQLTNLAIIKLGLAYDGEM